MEFSKWKKEKESFVFKIQRISHKATNVFTEGIECLDDSLDAYFSNLPGDPAEIQGRFVCFFFFFFFWEREREREEEEKKKFFKSLFII